MATAKKAAKSPTKSGASAAKKAPARASSATKAPAKKPATAKKAAPAKKQAPSKKAAPAKKPLVAAKNVVAKKAAPAAKKTAQPVAVKKPAPAKATPAAKKASAPPAKAPVKAAPAKAAEQTNAKAPAKQVASAQDKPTKKVLAAKAVAPVALQFPAVKGVTKDGISYTKDFDAKFLTAQKELLLEERAALVGQATLLEDEANHLIEEQEMGDVQFDDEGGEGDTMVVERERDLALSAQARQTVADIDAALERMSVGTYGFSLESARPIPRERLEAIPWATVLVEEKVGGIGRR
jgi:RNA polymerase-binding transcription factor DksA